MIRRLSLPLVAIAFGAGITAAFTLLNASFQGAPAGASVPFTSVVLPPVRWQPGPIGPQGLPNPTGFAPGVESLVSGELVITNERQMRYVWRSLFATPYDASQFDFHSSFVIWMGGGVMDIGSFAVSSVEEVAANYSASFPGSGSDTDPFLAATATTYLPGNPPQITPPPYYAVSAVKVPRAFFDDVVFHRTLFAAP